MNKYCRIYLLLLLVVHYDRGFCGCLVHRYWRKFGNWCLKGGVWRSFSAKIDEFGKGGYSNGEAANIGADSFSC